MHRQEFGKLLRLAIPLSLAQLAHYTVSFVDTLMVGSLGTEALAGIAIGSTTFYFVFSIVSGIIYAISPMVSHAVGAEDHESVPDIVRHGCWFGLIFSIPPLLLFWNIAPVLTWLGQDTNVVQESSGYLRAISFGIIPALMTVSLRGFLEGTGKTRPILVVAGLAIALNVFFNYAFMFGHFGLPRLGLVGTGVASSIVYSMLLFIVVAYIRLTQHVRYPIFQQLFTFNSATLAELFRIGLPITMTIAFENGLFAASAFAMGIIDPQQLAAHQIALQSAAVTFMVALGIALATCVRVGQFAGASDLNGARVAGQVGMLTATGVMVVPAIVFAAFPAFIIGLYVDQTQEDISVLFHHSITFLRIAALFQIADGLQVAASNALRGLKETKAAMYLTLLAYWAIGAPACVFLAFGLKLEGRGLWFGLTIGLAAAALMLTIRFVNHFRAARH